LGLIGGQPLIAQTTVRVHGCLSLKAKGD